MRSNLSVIGGGVCLVLLLIVPMTVFAGNGSFDPATGKFNMVVSVRWNATQAELDAICAEFQSASGILLDATDGTNQFGLLLIANNSTASNSADYWILKADGRSGAPTCNFGTNGQHITMYRGATSVAARYDEVIVHETAHYAYCVRDEYEGPATGGCGAANCNDNPSAICIGGANACLMEGPSDGNSEFCWTGNHDPNQDTEQHCDKCQSCWTTMATRAFALVEPAGGPAAAAPAADDIACLYVDDVPRIVIVLDRSGSMGLQDRLLDAQKAAKLVVDLVETGTYLGVASFSTDAGPDPDYDLQPINAAGDRTDAKTAIDDLSASGTTNYTAGLDLALSELTRVGLAAANKSIIFLSDGANNTPGGEAAADVLLWDKIGDLADDNIVVNTLGVGDELETDDEDRLRRMADDTDGEYSRTPIPFATGLQTVAQATSLDDFKPSFARYWAASEERAELASSFGSLPWETYKVDTVYVDASMAQATFLSTWEGQTVCSYPNSPDYGMKFWLVAPDNSTIDPSMSGQPGILFVQDCASGYAFFKISAPELMVGNWLLYSENHFEGPEAAPGQGDVDVTHQVFARSAVIWQACSTRPRRQIGMGEDLFVQASAFFGAPLSEVEAISGDLSRGSATDGEFTMMGRLLTTAGVELYQFELHDLGDAASGDQERADGAFTGRVPAAVLGAAGTGTYKVVVDIVNTGGAFYAGQHARPAPEDGVPLPIPLFQRSCWASIVYNSQFAPPANHPPVPNAGQDQSVECSGWPTTAVQLDGTGSYDPDGDPLSYTWTATGITFDDAHSATPVGNFPLGTTTVTLTVSDGEFEETDTVDITVVDTTPPTIDVVLNRDVLWPPNHKMADIMARVAVTDACCVTPPAFVLVSITSDEPEDGKGDGKTAPDIMGAEYGTPDVAFQLRSERMGGGDGRVYTIVYRATDCSGNTADKTVYVRVPHDHAGWALASEGFQAGGIGFDPALERFVLVIPSKPATYGFDGAGNQILASPAFDATTLDITRTYVGNLKGVVLPNESLVIDNNADGLQDLALYYPAREVNTIMALSTPAGEPIPLDETWGAIGLHYVSSDGVDYLVPNIFLLGDPVPLVPPIVVRRTDDPGDGGGTRETPNVTALLDIRPNPFNPTTTIPFHLVTQERVSLRIYDAQGKLVRTLVDEVVPAGTTEIVWDGRDGSGSQVATGVYFVRFAAGSSQMTKKIVMIK